MNNGFRLGRGFDSYYDPPEDPPQCEDGCWKELESDIDGNMVCNNPMCPKKFDPKSIEYQMAGMVIDQAERIDDLEDANRRLTLTLKSIWAWEWLDKHIKSFKRQAKHRINRMTNWRLK